MKAIGWLDKRGIYDSPVYIFDVKYGLIKDWVNTQ